MDESELTFIKHFVSQRLLQAATMVKQAERQNIPPDAWVHVPELKQTLAEMVWVGMVQSHDLIRKEDVTNYVRDVFQGIALRHPERKLTATRIEERVLDAGKFFDMCVEFYGADVRKAEQQEATAANDSPIVKP